MMNEQEVLIVNLHLLVELHTWKLINFIGSIRSSIVILYIKYFFKLTLLVGTSRALGTKYLIYFEFIVVRLLLNFLCIISVYYSAFNI